jgi:hypothetical protein
MFTKSNCREFFFLQRDTNSKENAKELVGFFSMNMEIATNFEMGS